jgi:transposase
MTRFLIIRRSQLIGMGFRDSDIFRQLFEAVVRACMDAGLVKGEGFAVDASVIEADASRYHGKGSKRD